MLPVVNSKLSCTYLNLMESHYKAFICRCVYPIWSLRLLQIVNPFIIVFLCCWLQYPIPVFIYIPFVLVSIDFSIFPYCDTKHKVLRISNWKSILLLNCPFLFYLAFLQSKQYPFYFSSGGWAISEYFIPSEHVVSFYFEFSFLNIFFLYLVEFLSLILNNSTDESIGISSISSWLLGPQNLKMFPILFLLK